MAGVYCDEGTSYWVDGCGKLEEVKELCACGCTTDHTDCRRCDCTCHEVNDCCDGCTPVNEDWSCSDGDPGTRFDTCRQGACVGRIMEIEPPALPAEPAPIRLRSWTCPPGWNRVEHDHLTDEDGNSFSWCEPPRPPRLRAGGYVTPLGEGEQEGDRPVCDPGADGTFPLLGSAACRPLGDPCPPGQWPQLPPDVTGRRHYVLAGAAGGDGSEAAPFGTIGEAVAAAASGEVVLIAAGTYPESLTISRDLTLWGKCVSQTVIDAPGPYTGASGGAVVVTGEAQVGLRNLRITGEQNGVRVGSAWAHVSLEGVWIHSTARFALLIEGGSARLSGVLVESTRPDPNDGMGYGLYVANSGTARVESSLFESNRGFGVVALERNTGIYIEDSIARNTLARDVVMTSGVGFQAEMGASAEIRRSLFTGNRNTGITASNAGTAVYLEDVVVRDTLSQERDCYFGIGVLVVDGAEVNAARTLIERNRMAAIQIESAGRVDLEDVVVRDTRSQEADLSDGYGMAAFLGASAGVRRGLFEKNREFGVIVADDGSSCYLSDVAVLDTRSQESDRKFGWGIHASDGAHLTVERGLIARNRGVGVYLFESTAEISDITVRDTLSQEADLINGVGMKMDNGAIAEVHRATISSNRVVGIGVADPATDVTLEDVTVRDTLSREKDLFMGYGLEVHSGARVSVTRGLFARNRELGILLAHQSTELSLFDVTISDTKGDDALGRGGRGLHIQEGASATLSRVLLQRNRDLGIGIFHSGGTLSLESVGIQETLPRDCALPPDPTCEGSGTGLGVYDGATVVIDGVEVSDSHLAGLQIAVLGSMSGQWLLIARNRIGVNIQGAPAGYDFSESVTEVWMEDNQVNFDGTALQVPDSLVEIGE